jgi:hypothetical protein
VEVALGKPGRIPAQTEDLITVDQHHGVIDASSSSLPLVQINPSTRDLIIPTTINQRVSSLLPCPFLKEF